MGVRIKGQEIEIMLVVDGKPQTTINLVKNFEIQAELEILSEGFLGQTTDQKDSVFNGVSGKMTVQFENQDVLKLMSSIIDKARRRTPGVQINIKATLNFANGQRPRILIPRCEFGAIPVSFGGRKEFGSMDLSFEASEVQTIF